MVTDKQPEALMLADYLEQRGHPFDGPAATELRRLYRSEREGWRHADELEQDRKRLHEVNAELVETLNDIAEWTERYTTPGHPISTVARAALAKAEEK